MNFHKPQSQCTSKVIAQSCKVSKYLKQEQNVLHQLDPVRFVPKAVIFSPGHRWALAQGSRARQAQDG